MAHLRTLQSTVINKVYVHFHWCVTIQEGWIWNGELPSDLPLTKQQGRWSLRCTCSFRSCPYRRHTLLCCSLPFISWQPGSTVLTFEVTAWSSAVQAFFLDDSVRSWRGITLVDDAQCQFGHPSGSKAGGSLRSGSPVQCEGEIDSSPVQGAFLRRNS